LVLEGEEVNLTFASNYDVLVGLIKLDVEYLILGAFPTGD
jgi:hypothetical protein